MNSNIARFRTIIRYITCAMSSAPSCSSSVTDAQDAPCASILSDCDGDYIAVCCEELSGKLYLKKYDVHSEKTHRGPGKCVLHAAKYVLLSEFETLAGKGGCKNWKRSVMHSGQPVGPVLETYFAARPGSAPGSVPLLITPDDMQPRVTSDMRDVYGITDAVLRGGCRIFGKGGLLNAKGWYSMVAIRPPSLGGSGGTPPQEILRFEVL